MCGETIGLPGACLASCQDGEGHSVHPLMALAEARGVPGRPDGGDADVDAGERPPELDVAARVVYRVLAQVVGERAPRAFLVMLRDQARRDGRGEHRRVPRIVHVDRHRLEQLGELPQPDDIAGRRSHVHRERGVEELVACVGVGRRAVVGAQLS